MIVMHDHDRHISQHLLHREVDQHAMTNVDTSRISARAWRQGVVRVVRERKGRQARRDCPSKPHLGLPESF
jgi:hypothetical protein